jgi:hypothetical protein
MTNREQDRIRTLLKQALTPIGEGHELGHDLWPEMQNRIGEAPSSSPASPAASRVSIPWFDWVLAGGVALVAVAFPALIPVLLYYL